MRRGRKLAYGWLQAKLSPGHQKPGSKFEIESPNALIGLKFSQPAAEIWHDQATRTTLARSPTVGLIVENLDSHAKIETPANHQAIVHKNLIVVTTITDPAEVFDQMRRMPEINAPAPPEGATNGTLETLLKTRQSAGNLTPATSQVPATGTRTDDPEQEAEPVTQKDKNSTRMNTEYRKRNGTRMTRIRRICTDKTEEIKKIRDYPRYPCHPRAILDVLSVCYLLLLVNVWSCPASAQTPTCLAVSAGLRYDLFLKDDTPQTVGFELTAPVSLSAAWRGILLGMDTAFSSANVFPGQAPDAQLSSLTDLRLSASYALPELPVGLIFGADLNLPIGAERLKKNEIAAEAGQNHDLFEVDNFGEGLNVGVNLGLAKKFDTVSLSLNTAYEFKGEYDTRVFYVGSGTNVTIHGLTITQGLCYR